MSLRSELQTVQTRMESIKGQNKMLEQAISHYKILMQDKRNGGGSAHHIKSSTSLEQQYHSEVKVLKQQLEESECSWQEKCKTLSNKNELLQKEVGLLISEVDRKTDLVNNTRGEWTKSKQANQRITKERNSFKQQLKDAELRLIEQGMVIDELR